MLRLRAISLSGAWAFLFVGEQYLEFKAKRDYIGQYQGSGVRKC